MTDVVLLLFGLVIVMAGMYLDMDALQYIGAAVFITGVLWDAIQKARNKQDE